MEGIISFLYLSPGSFIRDAHIQKMLGKQFSLNPFFGNFSFQLKRGDWVYMLTQVIRFNRLITKKPVLLEGSRFRKVA